MKWPWRAPQSAPPRVLFVICEKGVPVLVCESEAAVREALTTRDRRVTRVHQVPRYE